MTLSIQPLASGSKGNAVLLRTNESTVLVDAGLPRGQLLDRLDQLRVRLGQIDALLLSHTHADHCRSALTLSRRGKIPLYASSRCLDQLGRRMAYQAHSLPRNGMVEIAGLRVHSFPVEHDALETLGFRFEHEEHALGYCTDLGSYGGSLFERLRGVHGLYLEFNHDRAMLRTGPYPSQLRERVAGPRGHLSNEQAAEVLRRLAHPGLRFVFLAHLSQVNNSRELALEAAQTALTQRACEAECLVAEQDIVSPARLLC